VHAAAQPQARTLILLLELAGAVALHEGGLAWVRERGRMRERKRCEEMRGMRVQGTVPGTVPPGGVLPAKGRRVAREASEVARRGGSRKGALRLFGPAGSASGRNRHAPVPPSPTRMSLKLGTPVARGAAQALSKPAFAHNCCSLARGNAPAGTFMPGRAILRAHTSLYPRGH